jgi:anti-repressor protein
MGTLNMNQAAKILGIGRNKLFQILREHSILEEDNTPYQSYIDRELFDVVAKQVFPSYSRKTKYEPVTLVTDKGLVFLHKFLLENGYDVKDKIIEP